MRANDQSAVACQYVIEWEKTTGLWFRRFAMCCMQAAEAARIEEEAPWRQIPSVNVVTLGVPPFKEDKQFRRLIQQCRHLRALSREKAMTAAALRPAARAVVRQPTASERKVHAAQWRSRQKALQRHVKAGGRSVATDCARSSALALPHVVRGGVTTRSSWYCAICVWAK